MRELHLSDFQALYENASIEREEIVNLVASLVMACPFLERLVGFHIPFAHTFDRLSHAISTRPNLRERVWLLEEKDAESSEEEDEEFGAYYLSTRDPTERFLELNAGQPLLSTLVLHQEYGQASASLNFRAIVGTFRQLPGLRHLSLSGLPATSFTNLALNALPPNLQSLRLENLPGINDKGLQRFFTSRLATSIEKLTLVNLEIRSLDTVSHILSPPFGSLKQLTLIQHQAPCLSSLITVPNLHSKSLQRLHWEIRSQAGPAPTLPSAFSSDSSDSPPFPFANSDPISCLATSLLAAGIKDGAFPSLRQIRIPHDPQGLIQSLCKPLCTALLPSDAALVQTSPRISGSDGFSTILDHNNKNKSGPHSANVHGFSAIASPSSPRADSAIDSPTSKRSFSHESLTPMRSRLAAQSRILAARKKMFMTLRVYNPEGVLRLEKNIGGFMGQVGSKITYELRAPRSGMNCPERSEWIAGVEDLVGEMEGADEERERSRGVCGHLIRGRVGKSVVTVEDIF